MLPKDSEGNFLFPIHSDPLRQIYAGHLTNRTQVLLELGVEGEVIAAFFNDAGGLLEIRNWKLPDNVLKPNGDVDEGQIPIYLERDLGLTQDIIRIKEFLAPENSFGVYHLPDHYKAFLANPHDPSFDDDDRAAYPELIQFWIEQGQFVLLLGNDFWLDETGEIVAS